MICRTSQYLVLGRKNDSLHSKVMGDKTVLLFLCHIDFVILLLLLRIRRLNAMRLVPVS